MANDEKIEKDETVYVTIHDSAKPDDCLDRTTAFSANGDVFVFDEVTPYPIKRSVLKMIMRAKNINYRAEALPDGNFRTRKMVATRYTIEEHEKPADKIGA